MQLGWNSDDYQRSISVCWACADILRLETLSTTVAVIFFLIFRDALIQVGCFSSMSLRHQDYDKRNREHLAIRMSPLICLWLRLCRAPCFLSKIFKEKGHMWLPYTRLEPELYNGTIATGEKQQSLPQGLCNWSIVTLLIKSKCYTQQVRRTTVARKHLSPSQLFFFRCRLERRIYWLIDVNLFRFSISRS